MFSHRTRTLATFAGLAGLLMLFLVGATAWSFRQFSTDAAAEHARTAAEIVRVALTESMANGTISLRQQLLGRLAEVTSVRTIHLARGAGVVKQYGPGFAEERAADSIEEDVLRTGVAHTSIMNDAPEPVFRATIPYLASARGVPNCLQCHQVSDGSVLGAVTVTVSLAELRRQALWSIAAVVVAVCAFTAIALFLLRRVYQPMVDVAMHVQRAAETAGHGDFTARIPEGSNGEAGRIAVSMNRLMALLQQSVADLGARVQQLMRVDMTRGSNVLATTLEMVEGLVEANEFKQTIEEDETKGEVYARLARVIREKFDIRCFTIYEVPSGQNRLEPVIVGRECPERPDADAAGDAGVSPWCDPQVLVRADACRARRTGRLVNSFTHSHACPMFRAEAGEASALGHICVPIIQSGTVGCVTQLVARPEEAPLVQAMLPLMRVYLREASPVLEAKRLTESLRDASLRDAMTGLYNRRFLEEYADTLVAGTQRRKSHATILMLDLDYFKKVNDAHGHETGDRLLVELARTMQRMIRAADVPVRYGGEEFLIVLHDTRADGGVVLAEKIRAEVAELKLRIPGGTLQKTVSIGVAEYPGDADNFWQVVKYADVALYKAKERGRNRVERFTADMWSAPNGEY